MNNIYIYIYLDPTKPGKWFYENFVFNFEPFYVGRGVNNRYKVHLTKSGILRANNEIKNHRIEKIKDRRLEPIILKTHLNLNIEQANYIESDMIKIFGRICNKTGILTNISEGNDITPANSIGNKNIHHKNVFEYDLNGNFIKLWDCGLREIGRTLNKPYNTIADCCRGKTNKAYSSMWFYEYKGMTIEAYSKYKQEHAFKKTYVFDLYGNLTHEFKNMKKACDFFNIDKSNLNKIILNNKKYKNLFFSYDKKFVSPPTKVWEYKEKIYFK